jgi:23S rRNA (cytosine1962-C5)-methyltransferase
MVQEIVLKKGRDRRLRMGHLWVFSNEVATDLKGIEQGSIVDVLDANGRFFGRGYINPHSLICTRILTKRIQEIDGRFFKRRIDAALNYRKSLYPGKTTYRLVHGTGDFLPGLIIDRYDDHYVIQANTFGIDRMLPMIVDALDELLRPAVIVARNDTKVRELEGLPLETKKIKGQPNPDLQVEVGSMKFRVDILHGQKTGLFLDQAENYLELEGLADSAKVLDCFCYTCGWGLHAAHFGAREVVAVDSSQWALDRAAFSAALNNITNCTFVHADVFETLNEFDNARERFDMVILDPPAFAKSKSNLTEALRAYKEINLRAMKILNPNGVLVTCSCSFHVSRDGFFEMLRRAGSDAGRVFRIIESRTQARDHPILLPIRETEYLKCAILKVV